MICALIGAVLCTVVAACPLAADQPEKLRIVVLPSEIAAAAYYADELGYFKDAGIDPEITSLPNGAAGTAAVISGSEDVGFSNTLSLISAHDKGLPISILAALDVFNAQHPLTGFLAVLKSSPIHTAKDFSGKTIALSGLGNTQYYALRNWIDVNGGDSKLVKFIEFPMETSADGIIAGKFDAADLDATNMFAARSRASLREVASTYESIAPRFMAGAWFATPDWIQKHPELARKFVGILQRVAAWANSHPDESAALYAKHTAFSLSDIKLSPRPIFVPATSPNLLQPVIDVAVKYGAIKTAFPASDVLSTASTIGVPK